MSLMWSAADIARASRLPLAGVMLMIECYFDDSGTHEGAPVVVWGGVIGTVEQFQALDASWGALLVSPLPGKMPLRKFHLSHCRASDGEFSRYSAAERDHVQHRFRSAIIDSGVIPVAYGVGVSAWEARVKGPLLALFPPESAVFGQCAKVGLQVAEDNNQNVLIVFDQGGQGRNQTLYQRARDILPEGAKRTAAVFLDVEGSAGLQAADVVAHYYYRYAQQWLVDKSTAASPHFSHLLSNTEEYHYGMFDETEIDDIVQKLTASLRLLGVDL